MKALTVAEVKTHFSEILMQVKNGENVKILYGKAKKLKKNIREIIVCKDDKFEQYKIDGLKLIW